MTKGLLREIEKKYKKVIKRLTGVAMKDIEIVGLSNCEVYYHIYVGNNVIKGSIEIKEDYDEYFLY